MYRRKPRFHANKNSTQEKNNKSESAYNSLLRMLSRRDHSEHEIRQKLKRWYTDEATQIAIAKAQELSLIKDEKFLVSLFTNGLHKRQKGVHAINRVLKQKGLPTYHADEDTELSKCQALLLKKFPIATKLDALEKAKAYRYLAYRGFDTETIKKAINQFQAGIQNENRG